MCDFRIWSRIEHLSEHQFVVIVSAVPDPPSPDLRPIVETRSLSTDDAAETARAEMVIRVGEQLRAQGDRVVDVEE